MLAPGIVKPLNEVEQVGACFISGGVTTPVCPLQFQRREEAFHCCIVPVVTPTAHAAGDVLLGQQPLKLLAAVLAALVGVVQQCLVLQVESEIRRYGRFRGQADRHNDVAKRLKQVDNGLWPKSRVDVCLGKMKTVSPAQAKLTGTLLYIIES